MRSIVKTVLLYRDSTELTSRCCNEFSDGLLRQLDFEEDLVQRWRSIETVARWRSSDRELIRTSNLEARSCGRHRWTWRLAGWGSHVRCVVGGRATRAPTVFRR